MANTSPLLGFEARLWQAADALRGSMDAAEYKQEKATQTVLEQAEVLCEDWALA